jgi:glycosyltransferase involved in cell wall biosynthesis
MKILVVTSKHQPEYSGSGLRARNTYKRLKKNYNVNYDILTNSINFQGNKSYIFDRHKIFRISPPFKIPKKRTFWRNILVLAGMFWECYYCLKYFKKNINKYDLIHTFGNTWSIGFLTWQFSLYNKPIIRELCTNIENPLYPIQFERYMKNIFQKKNTLIIAISKKLQLACTKFKIKNIWMRFNQVNEKKFFCDFKKKNFFRKKLTKFNKKDRVMCIIANYNNGKNQLFGLEVLSLLPKKYKLILAGPLKEEGKQYFELLKKKIYENNLFDRVEIQTGFVDNIDEYIKCSDVFLFPSKEEGLGTPVLEAQACGIPVVSNFLKDVTNTMIENDKGGYCVKLNKALWVKFIQKAIKIPRTTLIKNSKKIFKESASKKIDQLYFEKITKLISISN